MLNCSLLSPSSCYLQNFYLFRSFCLPKGGFITVLWGRLAFVLSIGVATFIYIYIFDKKPLFFYSLSITKFFSFSQPSTPNIYPVSIVSANPPLLLASAINLPPSPKLLLPSLFFFSHLQTKPDNLLVSLSLISQTKPFDSTTFRYITIKHRPTNISHQFTSFLSPPFPTMTRSGQVLQDWVFFYGYLLSHKLEWKQTTVRVSSSFILFF